MRCLRWSGRAIIISRTPFFTKSNTPIVCLLFGSAARATSHGTRGPRSEPAGEGKSTIARVSAQSRGIALSSSRERFPPSTSPTLPPTAQKILDPNGPGPAQGDGGQGPRARPQARRDARGHRASSRWAATRTPRRRRRRSGSSRSPLLNGALAGRPPAGRPRRSSARSTRRTRRSPRRSSTTRRSVADTVVGDGRASAREGVCELIATNEERLLAHPAIIEKLYLNKNSRMSTADRILELAVRNDIELGIPGLRAGEGGDPGRAHRRGERRADVRRHAVQRRAGDREGARRSPRARTPTRSTPRPGKEEVVEKAQPLHAVWADLRPPAKIRLLTLGDAEGRTTTKGARSTSTAST